MKPPISELQEAIAAVLAEEEKAYDLVGVCKFFGLDAKDGDNAWSSKRIYVRSLTKSKSEAFLIDLAMKVSEHYGSEELQTFLKQYVGGVQGNVKNLIFAAKGEKPKIVLLDAVSNDIKIVQNEQNCLTYDKAISERGLLWTDLIEWWCEREDLKALSPIEQERRLYNRLFVSLDSPPEKLLFRTYFEQFREPLGKQLPALIPQVYLHYDPYTIRQLADEKNLVRQRMDFLLLFSNRDRVVLEVDGQKHYSENNTPRPDLYAEMVAEDRRLRLAGYEIYRFGGYELFDSKGKTIVTHFFQILFKHHKIAMREN
ncbi:MAG: hypothetical protein M3Y39_13655 [Chloroflexota bacterium]|nr:hypothetical protein [Chloroflexota bacterium]